MADRMIAALERELEFYERQGKSKRAEAVRDEIKRRGGSARKAASTSSPATETAAEEPETATPRRRGRKS